MKNRVQFEQVKISSALPWGGSLGRMEDSIELATQAGQVLAKQSSIGSAIGGAVKDVAIGAAKLPIEGIRHAGRAAWNTSRATKGKAALIGGGLALGGGAIAAGHMGGKLVGGVNEYASLPEGQTHLAHVMTPDELEKQALNFRGAKAAIGAGLRGAKETFSAARAVPGTGIVDAARMAITGGRHAGTQAVQKTVQRAERSAATAANKSFGEASQKAQQAQAPEVASRVAATKARLQGSVTPPPTAPVAPAAPAATAGKPRGMSSQQRRIAAGDTTARTGVRPPPAPAPTTGQVAKPPAAAATPTPTAQPQIAPPAGPQPPVQSPVGQVAKPPAVPPPPPPPKIEPPAQANMAMSPQHQTQPTGQPAQQQPSPGTQAQKGQQAAITSSDNGAAAVQTPQASGKGTLGKIRGAVPWVGAGLGLGAAGIGVGGAMAANSGLNAMKREGHFNNSYQYGAPIAGSASPMGYVTGPGM